MTEDAMLRSISLARPLSTLPEFKLNTVLVVGSQTSKTNPQQ